MKLRVTDQLHISSVSPHTLAAGAEIEVSKDLGAQLLEKHPDKVEAVAEAKAEEAPRNKAEKPPANKTRNPSRRKRK